MKNCFKCSILITIVLLITTSLVNAQPVPIGQSTQAHPYESNPTDTAYFMVGSPSFAGREAMKDGDLSTSGGFVLGAPSLLRPDGDGYYTAWTNSYTYWWDEVSDGDKSYCYTTTTSAKETSTLEDPPADASGTITSVTVYAMVRKYSGTYPTVKLMLRLGSTDSVGSDNSLTTSYALKSETISRPGGGSWSWDDITNLEAGVQMGTASGNVRVTQLYIEVDGPTTGYFELNTFSNWPTTSFTIGFVDLKMEYKIASNLTDDSYKIEYSIDGSTWVALQSTITGGVDWTMFDKSGSEVVRPWSQVARPGGGSWSWDDIGSLRIRITVTQNEGAWDGESMYIFEAWASVYPSPLPPSGGTPPAHLAVIPSAIATITTGEYLFVDIYVTGVSQMAGFYLLLTFNNLTLTPDVGSFIYYPFNLAAASPVFDDTNGWVVIQQGLPDYEPSFTGSAPIARIYFLVDQAGTSPLNIIDQAEFNAGTWPEGFSKSKLKNIAAVEISHQVHDGSYGAVIPEFPFGIEILMAIAPLITIIYLWRKRPKKR